MPPRKKSQAKGLGSKKPRLRSKQQPQTGNKGQKQQENTTNAVTQKQSQELTQSLLLAAVSTILHLRDLVHPDSFRLAHFDAKSSEPWSYEDWKVGKMKSKHDNHTQSMPLLQRNDNVKAQAFMDYIEVGAFDAIRQGYLRSFQVRIFADRDHQENVMETHTLTFSYHNRVVSGVEMASSEGKRFSLANLKIGLAEFVRDLSAYVNELPELPEERYFKPKLFYNDDAPDGYHAPGFQAPQTTVISFPGNEELAKNKYQLSYNGGFHDVNMTISHMQWLDKSDGAIPSGSDLVYSGPVPVSSDTTHETANFGVGRFAKNSQRSRRSISETLPAKLQGYPPYTRSIPVGTATSTSRDGLNTQGSSLPTTPGPAEAPNASHEAGGLSDAYQMRRHNPDLYSPETSERKETHRTTSERRTPMPANLKSSHVRESSEEQRKDCTSFSKSNQLPNATSDAQAAPKSAIQTEFDSQDRLERSKLRELRRQSNSQAHDTQLLTDGRPPPGAKNSRTQEHSRLKLTQTKVEELNEQKRLRDADSLAAQHEQDKAGSTDKISCQCGCDEEEEESMLFCNWCSTWQHCRCYGFQGASDHRIPHEHACYRCLAEIAEDAGARRRLQELKHFTILRRAIQVIKDQGFHNNASLARALGGCDSQTAFQVLEKLVSEKAVVKNKGSRYQVATKEPERSYVNEKFFNPLYNITSYYTSETGDSVQKGHNAKNSTARGSQNRQDHTGYSQASYNEQSERPLMGAPRSTSHSLREGNKRGLLPQHEPPEGLEDDGLGGRTPKRRLTHYAGDHLNINHGSPADFMRGISADR